MCTISSIRPKRRAFTLLELLVVVGVLGILVSLLLPMFSKVREYSRRTVCLSNLHQLGAAAIRYATDHDGYYPGRPPNAPWPPQVAYWGRGNADMRGLWVGYVPGYTIQRSSRHFYCPSNDDPGLLNSTYEAWSIFYPGIYVFGYAYFGAYHVPAVWVGSVPPPRRLNDKYCAALWGDVTESYLYTNGEPWSYAAHTRTGGVQWLPPGSKVAPEGMNCVMTDGSARWFSIAVDSNHKVLPTAEVEPCIDMTIPGFYWAKPAYH